MPRYDSCATPNTWHISYFCHITLSTPPEDCIWTVQLSSTNCEALFGSIIGCVLVNVEDTCCIMKFMKRAAMVHVYGSYIPMEYYRLFFSHWLIPLYDNATSANYVTRTKQSNMTSSSTCIFTTCGIICQEGLVQRPFWWSMGKDELINVLVRHVRLYVCIYGSMYFFCF
jgi:hypothetical protein